MNRKILFIVNPVAGGVSKRHFIDSLPGMVNSSIFDFDVKITECVGHASVLASETDADVVVSVGGDGTVNEVASALVGSDKVLGIVPFGSGNGLARHLGISMTHRSAISVLNRFNVRRMDCGIINGHYFFCTAGVGLDAGVDMRYSQCGSRGLHSYLNSLIKEWQCLPPSDYDIVIDGVERHFTASMVTVGNANQWGNNAFITPDASVFDGLLDVAVMDSVSSVELPGLACMMMLKKLPEARQFHYFRGREIVVRRSEEGPVHFDGEPVILGREINISAIKGAVSVIA